jgi:hypothetical protein
LLKNTGCWPRPVTLLLPKHSGIGRRSVVIWRHDERVNQLLRGDTLCSDATSTTVFGRVIIRPLRPAALQSLQDEVEREASMIVLAMSAKAAQIGNPPISLL